MAKYNYRDVTFSYLMLLPAIIIVFVFAFIPAFYALYLSFFKSNFLIFNRHFVGLSNYIATITSNQFWTAYYKIFEYTFWGVILQFVFGMLLALSLNKAMRGRTLFRTVIILPWTLSPVIIAIIFTTILAPSNSGLLNYFLMQLGILKEPVAWLGIGKAMTSVIITNTWFGVAFSMLMELAALQSIPEEIYEAARVDGATPFQTFFKVTLPLMKSVILINLIWITISTFNEFDLVYALTGGGPIDQTNLLGIHMYNTAFKAGKFELGSAIAILMFITNAFMTLVYSKVLKNKDGLS
jgi:multiple sugar transport system permease protein